MTKRSIFYGWWVVAAFSVMTFMSTGVRHAVGPFLKPIVGDLGLDRASFSAVIALSLFLYGVFMPLAGMALDRFSVRVVTSAGTLLLVASLVLTAMVRNIWEFTAVYGVLVPLGLAGTGPVIASGVVARWFSRRRGTALSVLGSASMTGMSLLVPAVTWLVLTAGWRVTYVVIAGLILVIALPLCLWVVRDSPESVGLTADGERPVAGAPAARVERVPAGEALRTLAFWQLAGSFFTCGFSMSLLSAHVIPMLTDHGYSPMFASWALGVLGGSSIGFTVMLGALSDRFGRRPVLASIYAGRVLIFAGFILLARSWGILYEAQRRHEIARSGPYAHVRHPQYLGFNMIMLGFLLQWPTLVTVIMFPLLLTMYVRLARREERQGIVEFGDAYRRYADRTPAFLPRLMGGRYQKQ